MGSHSSDSPGKDQRRKHYDRPGDRVEKDRDRFSPGKHCSRDRRRDDDDDDDDDRDLERKRKTSNRRDRRREDNDNRRSQNAKRRRKASPSDDSEEEGRRIRRQSKKRSKKKRHRKHRDDEKRKKKRKKRSYSSSSSSASSASDSESSDSSDSEAVKRTTKKVVNKKLLEKLAAKGETLEEWRERKSQKRAARIATKFGYTAEENPFNDPNLHETFTWKKKEEKLALIKHKDDNSSSAAKPDHVFEEIEKVRKRRRDRELQFEELERIRAEESRMKELENYDEWARKEEEFHLAQQRQRSAIRLVEGREKPIDVLAKNLLLFGLSDEDRNSRGSVKYQERYNALNALESLEAELEEPHDLLKELKLNELEELLVDIQAFMTLEREASAGNTVLQDDTTNLVLKYWQALRVVAEDEIKYLKTGGVDGSHAKMVVDIQKIFAGQSVADLTTMKRDVEQKLKDGATTFTSFGAEDSQDRGYWHFVLEQLIVYLAKMELSDLHSKMLVCQLEKLEQKKNELSKIAADAKNDDRNEDSAGTAANQQLVPTNVAPDFGNLEEELGLTDEIDMHAKNYAWQDKYRPRKPRYFNRVKTGYDWNKYNQTHYDHDNPPPKIVQGYKFNVFYPDLIDPTKTPQYSLVPADSDEFCILRFHAGPPYEDVAFRIVNREWNRSRKRGFRCTFERGVLSLYFNFTTHWYRR